MTNSPSSEAVDEYDFGDGCWNCDGDGYVYGCSWEWQCDTWDGDSCLCSRRCDVCNPAPRNKKLETDLSNVLATALNQTKEAGE